MKNEKISWYNQISIWWRFEGKYLHQDLIRGVKNLIKWFRIVWKDRDYDDSFIFEALKFKIEKTAEYTERRKWFVGWEIEVSRMRTCVELINRIQNDYYGVEYLDYQESTHEFIESDLMGKEGEILYEMKSEIVSENFDNYFKKYGSTYKKVVKKYGETLPKNSLALRMSNMNHQKAKKLLFNILEKHIESWWE